MKTEKDYEEMFITCVKQQGGHAFKIKMSSINGLPDMYCVMPGFVPVLLEAKLIKDVGAKFKRTIHYSKLQTELLKNCNKVNPLHTVAYGLVFVKGYMEQDYCTLMEPEIPTLTNYDITSLRHGLVGIHSYGLNVKDLFHATVPALYQKADHISVNRQDRNSVLQQKAIK